MVFGIALSNLPLLLILVGAGLIIAEAFAPGAHFFVAGVALFFAGVIGVGVSALFGGGIVLLLAMTVTVLVSAAATLYGYRQIDIYGDSGEGRTSDSSSLRGETGRVTEAVTPTDGKVKLDDGGFNPHYQARSIDGEIQEGTEVMVVDPGGGNVVTVESVSTLRDDIDRELDREAARQAEQTSE
jgi:membrane protein implicated in regulation of membrane protease activity